MRLRDCSKNTQLQCQALPERGASTPRFALQQSFPRPLSTGQWHFGSLLCIALRGTPIVRPRNSAHERA
jgi:hypothetical protein